MFIKVESTGQTLRVLCIAIGFVISSIVPISARASQSLGPDLVRKIPMEQVKNGQRFYDIPSILSNGLVSRKAARIEVVHPEDIPSILSNDLFEERNDTAFQGGQGRIDAERLSAGAYARNVSQDQVALHAIIGRLKENWVPVKDQAREGHVERVRFEIDDQGVATNPEIEDGGTLLPYREAALKAVQDSQPLPVETGSTRSYQAEFHTSITSNSNRRRVSYLISLKQLAPRETASLTEVWLPQLYQINPDTYRHFD